MTHLYVFDSVSFINYYNTFFNEQDRLSKRIRQEIDHCLSPDYITHKIILPSIVLVELFQKQLNTKDDEIASQFKYEILSPLLDNEDVEIKGIELDVLKIYSQIDNNIIKLENHDKIILSSAIHVDGVLITNDAKIQTYVEATNVVQLAF